MLGVSVEYDVSVEHDVSVEYDVSAEYDVCAEYGGCHEAVVAGAPKEQQIKKNATERSQPE